MLSYSRVLGLQANSSSAPSRMTTVASIWTWRSGQLIHTPGWNAAVRVVGRVAGRLVGSGRIAAEWPGSTARLARGEHRVARSHADKIKTIEAVTRIRGASRESQPTGPRWQAGIESEGRAGLGYCPS